MFLYLVYTSGDEVFCIIKDTSEPTPVDFYNLTDRMCLYDISYDTVRDDGTVDESVISDAVAAVDTGPPGNSNGEADEWHVWPDNMEGALVRFSAYDSPGPADYLCPECNTYMIPENIGPGGYFTLYILTDARYAVSMAYRFTPVHPDDTRFLHNYWNTFTWTWSSVTNQRLSRLYDPYCYIDGYDPADPMAGQKICTYNVRYVPEYSDFWGNDTYNWLMVKYNDYPEEPGDCSLWP